jgi:hypothetical protein
VKFWLAPPLTATAPLGAIVPPVPALAVIVWGNFNLEPAWTSDCMVADAGEAAMARSAHPTRSRVAQAELPASGLWFCRVSRETCVRRNIARSRFLQWIPGRRHDLGVERGNGRLAPTLVPHHPHPGAHDWCQTAEWADNLPRSFRNTSYGLPSLAWPTRVWIFTSIDSRGPYKATLDLQDGKCRSVEGARPTAGGDACVSLGERPATSIWDEPAVLEMWSRSVAHRGHTWPAMPRNTM